MSFGQWIFLVVFALAISITNIFFMRNLTALRVRDLLVGVVILSSAILAAVMIFTYSGAAFKALSDTIGLRDAECATAVVVVTIGSAAFWFKRKLPRWYGVAEMAFGVACAVKVSSGLAPGQVLLDQWTALLASAYIVARGLGSVSEAQVGGGADQDPASELV